MRIKLNILAVIGEEPMIEMQLDLYMLQSISAILWFGISLSEWLLLNAKWVIFQLYYGKNNLHWWDDDGHFRLDKFS